MTYYVIRSGRMGQKWYHRYYQSYDTKPTRSGKIGIEHFEHKEKRLSKNEKDVLKQNGVKTKNFNKWGTDENHNVLYIGGLSGSGKSTASNKLANNGNVKVIEADSFFYVPTDPTYKLFNGLPNDFKKLLDKNVKDWKKVNNKEFIESKSKEYGKLLDKISDQFEIYGKEQYKKGNKVIAEGVQFVDGTFFYKDNSNTSHIPSDKPQIYFINPLTSYYRRLKRENFPIKEYAKYIKDDYKNIKSMNQKLKDIDKETKLDSYNKLLKSYNTNQPKQKPTTTSTSQRERDLAIGLGLIAAPIPMSMPTGMAYLALTQTEKGQQLLKLLHLRKDYGNG